MAFGNNIAERSRKRDQLTLIRMNMVGRMSLSAAMEQTKGWHRKTVADLNTLRRAEFKAHPLKKSLGKKNYVPS